MSIERNTLLSVFNGLLQPERFKDYGPNGLQVEGKSEIRRIVSGVTASRALIEAAIEAGADAIFVHHGLFWRGMDGRITGWLKERIRLLLAHDINLFAYHLPLDAHAELGNNAQLGARLGVQGQAAFGDQNLGWLADADFADAAALAACARRAGAQGDAGRCARAQADSQAGLVHRRGAGLFRVRDCRRRRCLYHRRDLRAPDASGARWA
jgi:putative NIF3 family GTP cyclohydrolase 1 type 2